MIGSQITLVVFSFIEFFFTLSVSGLVFSFNQLLGSAAWDHSDSAEMNVLGVSTYKML